jgi:hypothetical protein
MAVLFLLNRCRHDRCHHFYESKKTNPETIKIHIYAKRADSAHQGIENL